MSFTIYGYIFVPVLLVLMLIKPRYLVYILIVSLSLQVTSIFNVDGVYSMQLYKFISILIAIRLIVYLLLSNFKLKIKKEAKSILKFGGLFTLFVNVWSYIAPNVFAGYPVFPPYLGLDYNAAHGPFPLEFSIYNIGISGYILLYFLVLVYIASINWNKKDVNVAAYALGISIFIVFATNISQLISLFGFPDITKYFYTATTRKFNYSLIGNFLPIPRIQATFFEPSMFAPFIVGVYSYFLYNLLNKINVRNVIFTNMTLFFIILSASTTAYLSAVVITFFVLINSNFMKLTKSKVILSKQRMANLFLAAIFISIPITIGIMTTIGFNKLIYILEEYLFKKTETLSYFSRTTADLHGIGLFFKTYGLGVGLGSNRPSSLLPYLLSQLGIIGTFLFVVFMFKIIFYCYKSLKDTKYFGLFFANISTIISMLIAYSDLTNPTLWQFIYLGILISLGVSKSNYDVKHLH